jgi:hypothetical protein
VLLLPLSWFGIALQKAMRPRSPAFNVAQMFARLRYDTSRIAGLAPAILAAASLTSSSEQELMLGSVHEPEDLTELASHSRQLA